MSIERPVSRLTGHLLCAQVINAAYGIQFMALQGFYIRGGVDSTAVEAVYNYNNRANKFQSVGGAQFLSTFFDVPPPANLLQSSYQVLKPHFSLLSIIVTCNELAVLPCSRP